MPDRGSFFFFHGGWPSQWHPSVFKVDGVTYGCAEQFMMAEKAKLFGDMTSRKKILASRNPREQKALGRKVLNFKEDKWTNVCREVVFQGNLAKFTQNSDLRELLVATATKTLAEASPTDRIWGIGLSEDDPRALTRSAWRGTNWLGETLMRVRTNLTGVVT